MLLSSKHGAPVTTPCVVRERRALLPSAAQQRPALSRPDAGSHLLIIGLHYSPQLPPLAGAAGGARTREAACPASAPISVERHQALRANSTWLKVGSPQASRPAALRLIFCRGARQPVRLPPNAASRPCRCMHASRCPRPGSRRAGTHRRFHTTHIKVWAKGCRRWRRYSCKNAGCQA